MLKDAAARLSRTQQWDAYRMLTLESPRIAAQSAPGQFIMIRVAAVGDPLLRRPFSLHAVREREIDIFFQVVGPGTQILSRAQPDQNLDILGPLGRGFDLDKVRPGHSAALMGGGRGIAPLYFLAEELIKRQVDIRLYYGGRSRKDLPLKSRLEAAGFPLICSTDDGSMGFKGFVTDCFRSEIGENPPSYLYACGPEAMLRTAGALGKEHGIPTQISLEAFMGCGFGACWGCVQRIRSNGRAAWIKVCEEGPVFPAEDVLWEEQGP